MGGLILEEAKKAERDSTTVESEKLRRDLNKLASEVGRLINEELKDIEADLLPYGSDDIPDIALIPEEAYAYIGENRTLTIVIKKEFANEGDIVNIKLEPEGIVELINEVILSPHRRQDDLLAGQIRLKPILEGEITIISANIKKHKADAMVEVRPLRTLIEEEVVPPEYLMFEKPSYRIGWQREKVLKVIAPVNIVAEQGEDIKISSYSPGVVVRTPSIRLKYDGGLDYYIGSIRIEARTLGASTEIRADLDDIFATTRVRVTRKEDPGPNIKIIPKLKSYRSFRAIYEITTNDKGEKTTNIKIALHHPSIKPFIDLGVNAIDTPIVRSLISEAIADVSARIIVTEYYQKNRILEDFDATRFYFEHNVRIERILPRIQRILIGSPNVAMSGNRLKPSEILEINEEKV